MTVSRTWLAQQVARADDATPVGIDVAVGATAVVIAMFVASAIPRAQPGWRCALVALAVGVFAATTVDLPAVAALVPGTWMVMDGFLVNRLGDLSWHGSPDAYRLLALIAAGGLGLALGGMNHRVHELRQQWRWGIEVQTLRDQIIGDQVVGVRPVADSVSVADSVPTETTRETTQHA